MTLFADSLPVHRLGTTARICDAGLEPPVRDGNPKILIMGYARHGKDTVAEMLRDRHGLSFQSSSLFAAKAVVRPALEAAGVYYPTLEACYEDRVNHRAFWYKAISAYNDDPTRLARSILAQHDMYVGMRSDREYQAVRHLFDYTVWVNASGRGLPVEPATSMDIVFDCRRMWRINNTGTLYDLRATVDSFAKTIKDSF